MPLAGLITLVFLVVMVHVATMSLHFFMTEGAYNYSSDMSIYLSGNWWWWVSMLFDRPGNPWGAIFSDPPMLFSTVMVATAAFCLTFFCLRISTVELVAPPSAVPARVLEELHRRKKALHPPGESIEDIFAARQSQLRNLE
jgi:hypothetical protein